MAIEQAESKQEVGRLIAHCHNNYWQFQLILDDRVEPMDIAQVHMMMVQTTQTKDIFQKAVQDIVAVSIQNMTEDSVITISDTIPDH